MSHILVFFLVKNILTYLMFFSFVEVNNNLKLFLMFLIFVRYLNYFNLKSKKINFFMKKNKINRVSELTNVGSNSVLSSSAQSTTLLHRCSSSDLLLQSIYDRAMANKNLGAVDRIAVELMLMYGLRVSEVLRITNLDLLPGRKVFVKSSKGSYNRIIDNPNCYGLLIDFLKSNINIGSIYSRFYFYRRFKQFGINLTVEGNVNHSVTHAGRHLQVRMLSESNVDSEDSRHYISHKSLNSTKHYEKNKVSK